MNLYNVFKVLHVVAAAFLLGGIVGRALLRAHLLRTDDINVASALVKVEGLFDEWLVARASLAILATGIVLTWLGRWPLISSGTPTWTLVSAVLFLVTIPLVILIYIPRGKAFGNTFQAAVAQRRITPELRAALTDQAIRLSHLYEYISIGIVITLMVMKPF